MMYACRACAKLYHTQEEADLCTPVEEIPNRYPSRARPDAENSAFNSPEES